MLLAWKNAGVLIYAGFITGFPGDTPETMLRDVEIIKKELPLDILEFMYLTPLPGSEDHKVLWQKGVWMAPEMNKYDLEHVTAAHPKMTREEWEKAAHPPRQSIGSSSIACDAAPCASSRSAEKKPRRLLSSLPPLARPGAGETAEQQQQA